MIYYDAIQRGDPRDPALPKKWYAIAHNIYIDDYRDLVDDIADRSIISEPDVRAVLEGLFLIIPRYLSKGRVIRLGDLGTIRVTLNSEGVEKEEDVSPHIIKRTKVLFKPGSLIKDEAGKFKFKKFGDDLA